MQGTFNTRPINSTALKRLVEDMKVQGIRRHQYSTAIPLLANPRYIHPTSIFKDITKIDQAPDLKLTKEGHRVVKRFYGAGGNHRTEAIKILAAEEQDHIEKLNGLINKYSDQPTKLETLRQTLEERKKTLDGMGKWTVILYNDSQLNSYLFQIHSFISFI